MGRITITISDANQRALEAEGKRRGVSLDAALTIQLAREARIAELRERLAEGTLEWDEVEQGLDDDDILEWAVQEVREYRREKHERERESDSDDHCHERLPERHGSAGRATIPGGELRSLTSGKSPRVTRARR